MIAVLVDEYEDAVSYVGIPNHPEPVFVVCKHLREVPSHLDGIAYLGGSAALRERAEAALSH